MTTPMIVIGVGNEYRSDDGLGPAVVALLRQRTLPGVSYAECDGEPIGLIELWQDADLAVVVDAVRAPDARPGRVHRLSASHPAAAGTAAASSHGVDLGDAVALARALRRMPRHLLLYAVEVTDTGFGIGLSEPVADAARRVADELAELLSSDLVARS
jgi:hydrogenase maturation protease